VFAWRTREGGEARTIRERIEALRTEVNASTVDGLGTAARATQIGSYFTDDAVVELGGGSVPIRGRETLMDMAARLQPRTAAFRLDLDDVGIEIVQGGTAADVMLTASFVRRSVSTGEESRDAREFAMVLVKTDSTWRISRITAIDTLR
ncbi:MAG TPA: nuclear transport factor 2 family protein, partial [Gemmatimonadaceae bacterium]|nr:nuclear transport factor 2 family protein [Gemmatimonadaceae bacterium]